MDYKVEAGDLSEKVKKEVSVIVASPAVVDEKTWGAIDIPAPAGHISTPKIYDYTDTVMYVESDFPISMGLNHQIDGNALFTNDMDIDQIFSLMLEFIDPDGVSRVKEYRPGHLLHAHSGVGLITDKVTLDIAGRWKLHALMEG